jgi:hypothetical protein
MNVIISPEEAPLLASGFPHTVAAPRGSTEHRGATNLYARLQAEDVVELGALSVLFLCVLVSIGLAAVTVFLFLTSVQP